MIFAEVAQCGFAARATSIKSACFVIPRLFRADSGTNLIEQGKYQRSFIGSTTQLSHG